MAYVEGQSLICEIEFRLEGVLTDPTLVRCFVRKPSGLVTEYAFPAAELVKIDTGIYEASAIADEPGTWAFRATGVGVVDAVQEVATQVAPSMVTS